MSDENKTNAAAPAREIPEALAQSGSEAAEVTTVRAELESLRAKK